MKNTLKFIFICLLACTVSGCNNVYIKSENANVNDKVYYGALKGRDSIHSDIVVFQKNSDLYCDGVFYLRSGTKSALKDNFNNSKMILGCNDGTLMNITWQFIKGSLKEGTGEGVDQYNNVYKFKTITKKEYEVIAENQKITFPNGKYSSNLKY